MVDLVTVYVKKDSKNIKLPEYKNPGDAGMDIYSNDNVHIKQGETIAISTGLFLQIPIGYYIKIVPRSGLSLNTPLRIVNSPGTIDGGYRGELKVLIQNTSDKNLYYTIYDINQKGNVSGLYKISKGDRIAQMILCKHEFIKFEVREKLDISERGIDGFGSTGIK
jgi:dUTP pyrophosphatase